MRWTVLLGTALLLVTVTGCVRLGRSGQPEAPVSMHQLRTPEGGLFGAAWLRDGWIYFGRSPAGRSETSRGETWRVRASGVERGRARAAGGGRGGGRRRGLAGCGVPEYMRADPLPDGRLGLARFCEPSALSERTRIHAGAFDPRTGRYEPLAMLRDVNPSKVTWR